MLEEGCEEPCICWALQQGFSRPVDQSTFVEMDIKRYWNQACTWQDLSGFLDACCSSQVSATYQVPCTSIIIGPAKSQMCTLNPKNLCRTCSDWASSTDAGVQSVCLLLVVAESAYRLKRAAVRQPKGLLAFP